MNITIIVEGRTETAFKKKLTDFLEKRIKTMPKIKFHRYDGRIPKEDRLKRVVENILARGADHVIALTDVYTGTNDFRDAKDAKKKMSLWVGQNSRFHPHAAQHDFEAWLLPYWDVIQQKAGHNMHSPQGLPETINHGKPPSYYIKEIFRAGKNGKRYIKQRDGMSILEGANLMTAINACPELKSFINTILILCNAPAIP